MSKPNGESTSGFGMSGGAFEERDALRAEVARLRALIDDMGCANEWYIEDCPKALPNNRDEWCAVCRAKQAAAQPLDGEGSNE